jgi:hypothetical protein
MALLFFWIKVAIKRIFDFSKPYILFALCAIILIGAFIYAFINGHININLDIKTIYIILSLTVLFSLVNSFRNYNLTPLLIKYSKSKYRNTSIIKRYFLKRALINNLLLIIFDIIAFYSIIKYSIDYIHIFILPGITMLSIFLSFIIMYIKNKQLNKRHTEIGNKKIKVSPIIKSAVYDYLSSDFLISIILCIIIFIAFIISIVKDINSIYELKNNSNLFLIITIIFSLGFTSIIGSMPKINWKFQSIVSPNSFKYHFKRTFFVLFGFLGWLILLFIVFGSLINIMLLIKYLYCLFILFFTIINISLTITNMMIKAFIVTVFVLLAMWISTLPVGFLSILVIPLIISFIKAKNEYREWYLK